MRVTNQEQPFHPIYNYAVITDAEEGLILVNVNTLADGDPRNNFLKRAVTWNPDGVLNGARHVALGGHYAYIAADAGLVVVDLDDPLQPQLAATVAAERRARRRRCSSAICSSTDARRLEVVDVTDPTQPRLVPAAHACRSPTRTGSTSRALTPTSRPARKGSPSSTSSARSDRAIYQKFNADGAARTTRAT